MGPSAYHAELAKDQVVEDRDQVKVVFAGGNVFHLHVVDVDKPETVRGVNKAWTRAEAIRKQVNPDYAGPPADEPADQQAATDDAETKDEPSGGETADEASEDSASTPEEGEADEADEAEDNDDETDEEASDEPAAEDEPAADPEEDPAADDEPEADVEEAQAPDTGDELIRIGGLQLPLRLIPVDLVVDCLGASQGRLDALQTQAETRRLHNRVRATDGRCAPIFFTQAKGEDAIHLFSGIRTVAAARNLGMKAVAVVIIPADRAGEVQGAVASLHTKACAEGTCDDDDDMIHRAYSDD